MPHFTVVASDPACVPIIDGWLEFSDKIGVSAEKMIAAGAVRTAVISWRRENRDKCKIPD